MGLDLLINGLAVDDFQLPIERPQSAAVDTDYDLRH